MEDFVPAAGPTSRNVLPGAAPFRDACRPPAHRPRPFVRTSPGQAELARHVFKQAEWRRVRAALAQARSARHRKRAAPEARSGSATAATSRAHGVSSRVAWAVRQEPAAPLETQANRVPGAAARA